MFHVMTAKVQNTGKNREKMLSEQAERTDTSERLLLIYKTRKDRNQQVMCKQSHCYDTASLNSLCPSLELTPGIGSHSANIALVSATDDDWWTGLQWTLRFTPTFVGHGSLWRPIKHPSCTLNRENRFSSELMYVDLLQRCIMKRVFHQK